MKKKLIVLSLYLLFAVSAFGESYYIAGSQAEGTCELCGKQVYFWKEPYYGPYMPSSLDSPWHISEPRRQEISITIYVCPACHEKYSNCFEEQKDNLIKKIREENKLLIKKHKEEARQSKIEKAAEEINELRERIKNLESSE